MRTHLTLAASHGATTVFTVIALAAAQFFGSPTAWLGAAVLIGASVGVATFILGGKALESLRLIRRLVNEPGRVQIESSGLAEFDETVREVEGHVRQWDDVAANSREQARELQAILTLLNRRQNSGAPTSSQLRSVLAGIGNHLSRLLSQIEQNTVEIGRCTEQVANNAEYQGEAVVKTSTYVEQLTAGIDSICSDAEAVHNEIGEIGQAAGKALELVGELNEGMDRIRAQSQASERKLRALDDPTRQIRAIVETIADLAGRTDLLALNASIESIRAGEHGRGFAIVADEVRKLAEQASQSTREVTTLIESLQIQTQESIAVLARERSEVDAEASLVQAAEGVLETICQKSQTDSTRAKKIASAGIQQLRLAQEVVGAVEQISGTAKTDRGNTDNARWAMKSLAKTALEFDSAIESLRNCGERRRAGPRRDTEDRPLRDVLETHADETAEPESESFDATNDSDPTSTVAL